MTEVKICGLTDAAMVGVALEAGADFLGFNFVRKSPRFIEVEAVQPLLALCREAGVKSVGLWQGDGSLPLEEVVTSGIDILQAHAVHPDTQPIPTWHAMGVSEAADLPAKVMPYDCLLLDAKPPKDAAYAGGHGASFDWTILRDWQAPQPWMLAGGLTPDNVAEAIAISGARGVDVSSGVEHTKGEKDADLIRAFIANAKAANA